MWPWTSPPTTTLPSPPAVPSMARPPAPLWVMRSLSARRRSSARRASMAAISWRRALDGAGVSSAIEGTFPGTMLDIWYRRLSHSVNVPPCIRWHKPGEMADILRCHDPCVVGCGGKDHLCGKNHIAIQRFIISRWTALLPGLRPEGSRLAHHGGRQWDILQSLHQGVKTAESFDFLSAQELTAELVVGNLRDQHPHSTG